MADGVSYPDIKRPNYFNSQLLDESDFNDEQTYHRDMRLLHNRSLHTCGIVQGLDVQKGADNKSITVSRGMAIDNQGNEIVLAKDATPTDWPQLQLNQTKDVYVTIKYDDKPDENTKLKDILKVGAAYSRKKEIPTIEIAETPPASDGSVIVLAKLTLNDQGVITNVVKTLPTRSRAAGSVIDPATDLTLRGLVVSGSTIQLDGNQQIKFTNSDTSNNLKLQLWTGYGLGINGSTLFYAADGKHSWRDKGANERMLLTTGDDGGLTVKGTGNSSFAGKLGIGTTDPRVGKLTVADDTPLGFSNASKANRARFRVSGEDISAKLHIDVLKSTGSGWQEDMLVLRGDGNVGIGTPDPGPARLKVDGTLNVTGTSTLTGGVTIPEPSSLSFGETGRQMINLWKTNLGIGIQHDTQYFRTNKNFGWFKGGTHNGGELDAGGGTVQMVIKDGNVGIGTASPGAKLVVGGTLTASTDNEALVALKIAPTFQDNSKTEVKYYGLIVAEGNVGIGTTAPNNKLDVRGGVFVQQLAFADETGTGYLDNWLGMANNITGTTKWLHIGGITDGDGTKRKRRLALYADTTFVSGNVGIGTTNPGAMLEVNGDFCEKLNLITGMPNHDKWHQADNPVMQFFSKRLTGKPPGTMMRAITDRPVWKGHYWQGWVDVAGEIRVVHNYHNTSSLAPKFKD